MIGALSFNVVVSWTFVLLLLFWAPSPVESSGSSLYLPFNTSLAFAQFSGLANATAFTLEFWAASTNPPHDMACALHIGVGKGGKFLDYWAVNIGDVTSLLVVGLKPNVKQYTSDREWHHYASTFGPDGVVAFYVDGELLMNQTMEYQPFPSDPVAVCLGQEADDYLGGFDPTQAYQGYYDEVRFWRVRRNQSEIKATMAIAVDENMNGLAAQWHFDDVANTGFATSAQGYKLIFGSARSVPNEPCDPFDLPFRSAFTAPIWQPPVPSFIVACPVGSRIRLPICVGSNCSSDPRYAQVSLVAPYPTNGQLLLNGAVILSSALPVGLASPSIVEYVSTTSGGDVVTYGVSYTEAGSTVVQTLGMGTITLRKDTAPAAESTKVTAKENANSTIALPGFDIEGDPLIAIIESLPKRGQLFQVVGGQTAQPITQNHTEVLNPGHGVIFVPENNVIGNPYASFTFSIRERNLYPANVTLSSAMAMVDVEVVPIDLPPVLQSALKATTLEGVAADLDIKATDPNQLPVSMVLLEPPPLGTLYMDGKPITSILPAANTIDQWVAKVLRFSSEYPGYNAFHLVGPPSRSTYGDSDQTYSAATADGECVSRGTDIFYTEFVEVQFDVAVFVKEVHVMQNTNPGTLTRILAPRSPTATPASLNSSDQWFALWYGPAVEFNGEQKYTVTSPSVCNTPFAVNILRLEFDTCHVVGWNLIDAIRLIGTTDRTTGQTLVPTKLRYEPWALYRGPPQVLFTFYITNCLGVTLRNSVPMNYNITVVPVNDPPVAVAPLPLAIAQSQPTAIQLSATDPDTELTSIVAVIITLPTHGTLTLSPPITSSTKPSTVNTVLLMVQDRFPLNMTVLYTPTQSNVHPMCGSEFTDSFSFTVFDGEKYAMELGTVSIWRMNCTSCPAPFLLDAGVCRRCPLGTSYQQGGDGVEPSCEAEQQPFPRWAIIVIIVVGSSFVLTMIGLVIYRSCMRAREQTNADKILRTAPHYGEVAMVFTDIQDSTPLWESFRFHMHAALEVHNTIVRQAILRFGGYEVSTSGDSFFVVFADPGAALAFAFEVQNEMLFASWPCEILDYEGCRLELGSDGHQILWQGLRVRMGIHLGTPTAEPNLETGRVEYFGSAVNFATRVSSKAHGGQIILSEKMYAWFAEHGDKEKFVVIDTGEHRLKGIEKKERLYSVLPCHLSERAFPEPQDLLCLRCKGPVWCLRCDGERERQSTMDSAGSGSSSPRAAANPRRSRFSSRQRSHLHHLHSQTVAASHAGISRDGHSSHSDKSSSVGSVQGERHERASSAAGVGITPTANSARSPNPFGAYGGGGGGGMNGGGMTMVNPMSPEGYPGRVNVGRARDHPDT